MYTLLQTAVRSIQIKMNCTFAVPENVDRYDHRTYYSMLIANFMALLLHLSWIFIFRGLGFTTLSLINVGSVGQSRDGVAKATYVIYDKSENTIELRRLDYDIAKTQAKIRDAGPPE